MMNIQEWQEKQDKLPTNKKLVVEPNKEFALEFSWKGDDTHWVDFKAIELDAYDEDGTVYCSGEVLSDFDKAYEEEKLCHGHIKWDGCMEIHDFSHHFCGYSDYMQRLMGVIYTMAQQIMGDNFDSDLANYGKE